MGNYAWLAKNRTKNPNYHLDWVFDYDDVELILMSKYMVPILWCTAFNKTDFITRTITIPGEDPIKEPVLMTDAEIGIERAISRRPKLCAMFSNKIDDLYDEWLKLLELFRGNYIHMDWSEVSAMFPDDELDQNVKSGVRAFEDNHQDNWSSLMGLSGIAYDPSTGLATISPRRSPTRSFKAQSLYGTHIYKSENDEGEMVWMAEVVEDETEKTATPKKPWWRTWLGER
jgi:hypothetical protein